MDDLLAEFLPRFIASAHARLARGRAAVQRGTSDDRPVLAQEMHALAGESAVLGLEAYSALARAAEQFGRRWSSASDPDVEAGCLQAIDALERALDGL